MSKEHHLVPAKVYIFNFMALTFLMALTVWAYEYDFGSFSLHVALGIAIAKMSLILLIFMNVKYSSRLAQIFAAAGFFWFLILLVFILGDFILPHLGTSYTTPLP